MDRTVIGPWKLEERDLSEKLYKKLHGLTLLYPPTEEFRKCVSEDMFLKPNPHAFFHVMHYLFKLHDPIEFRKRFYWPITDKKAEANFRSSTIEYLKHLDERHQLHWTNIKSYLVQMPGGMKFINFLLDFVSFVIIEQIKNKEKHLTSDIEPGQVTELNLMRMRKQNEFFKEYASAYICDADEQIARLKAKTALIQNNMQDIAKLISVDVTHLMDESFAKQFELSNRESFQQMLVKPVEGICSLEQPIASLKEAIDNFQSKKSEFQIDRDALRRAILHMQQLHPEDLHVADEEFQATPYDDSIKMDSLIAAFNVIHESIEEHLTVANKKPLARNFVTEELGALKTELQQIESRITDFQKKINTEMKKRTSATQHLEKTPMRIGIGGVNVNGPHLKRHNKENTLLMKFVATPPIKIEMIEGSQKTNTRLPLLDDFSINVERSMVAGAKAGIDTLNNLLAIPRSARKPKMADISIDFNCSLNKSKIIDPMQLLRTINRDNAKSTKFSTQNDRSALEFKWKERQCIFGKDIESSPRSTTIEINDEKENDISIRTDCMQQKETNLTTISSPFTPFNCNELTRITRSQPPIDGSFGGNGSNFLFAKKLSAVKKVQDASLYIHNLSTSPSGRLDPLVTMDDKDLPKLLLNDLSINELVSESDMNLNVQTAEVNTASLEKSSSSQQEAANAKKTPIISHTDFKFLFNVEQGLDDILNISDSVLKDAIM